MCVCVCVCVCACVRVCARACTDKVRNFLNCKLWTLEGYCCGTTRVIQLQSDANGGSKHADLSCGAL